MRKAHCTFGVGYCQVQSRGLCCAYINENARCKQSLVHRMVASHVTCGLHAKRLNSEPKMFLVLRPACLEQGQMQARDYRVKKRTDRSISPPFNSSRQLLANASWPALRSASWLQLLCTNSIDNRCEKVCCDSSEQHCMPVVKTSRT